MSLKIFHIVFITLSSLLSFGFGVWAIRAHYRGGGDIGYLVSGIVSFLAGGALIYYGDKFFKKMRKIK